MLHIDPISGKPSDITERNEQRQTHRHTEQCVTAEVTPTPQNLIKALKQKTIVIHRQPQEDRERESIYSADLGREGGDSKKRDKKVSL